MNKFYLTTAIAYVNGAPHIGHALEFVQGDALVRYHRLKGDDVHSLTGTDEHGSKIFQKAEEMGVETQAFVDQNAAVFRSLGELLDLSYDDFIRTTEERHKRGVQEIWQKLVAAGDIYKDSYAGKYCVGCEAFISDKDLDENGNCPTHLKPPEVLEEENYFFRLSKYSDQIRDLIEKDQLLIRPESKKKEFLNMIGEGLHDVSFSRPKNVLPWGIDVPGDEGQVMYVWCDALSNYYTALNSEQKKYWPADVHLIGKDILRFHAGIWIGMLLSAEMELPKAIYVHGFVTSDGQKMSKSIGNVVDPFEYVREYGTEALRYYLLREIPSGDDGDFTKQRFFDVHNSELANGLGNLVNRVTMMTEKYFGGVVPIDGEGNEVRGTVVEVISRYEQAFEDFDLKGACDCLLELVNFSNKYIDDKKPWVMAKSEEYGLEEVLYDLLELLRVVAVLLLPILPTTALKIAVQLGLKREDLSLKEQWGVMKKGMKVSSGEVLFPRLED